MIMQRNATMLQNEYRRRENGDERVKMIQINRVACGKNCQFVKSIC